MRSTKPWLEGSPRPQTARHRLPLLRVPADFEKFFNTLQLPLIDALQQGRGIPDSVQRLHQSLFSEAKVCLDTRVGLTTAISVTRGAASGQAAQDPILHLRARDRAAFCSCLQHIQDPRLHTHGASVSSWNIWQGGYLHAPPKTMWTAFLASAAQSWTATAWPPPTCWVSSSWDEARPMIQYILGGTLNYAPLVGLPAPSALHREDAALHRLIHASLGTRVTAET